MPVTSNKKFGRPPITEVYVSREEILEVYKKTHSMRKTAQHFRISKNTVLKYIGELGESFPRGTTVKPTTIDELNATPIAQAYARIAGYNPHRIKDVCRLMAPEYSAKQAEQFIRTRKKVILRELRNLGSVMDHPELLLRDIYGRIISVRMFSMYTTSIDQYNLVVTIHATLKFGGRVTCRLAFNALREILQSDENAPQITAP